MKVHHRSKGKRKSGRNNALHPRDDIRRDDDAKRTPSMARKRTLCCWFSSSYTKFLLLIIGAVVIVQQSLMMLLMLETSAENEDDTRISNRKSSQHSTGSIVHRDNSSNRPNKTLVILIGSLRCGEIAWQSLYENVLDVNNADLMVSTSDEVPDVYQNASLWSRASYIYQKPEYEYDWGVALDIVDQQCCSDKGQPNNRKSWHDKIYIPFYHPKNILLGLAKIDDYRDDQGKLSTQKRKFRIKAKGSGALVLYERWFLYQKIKELDLTKKYDRFVVTRSDHSYMCPLDLTKLSPDKLWVPYGEDWRGICDRFLIANSSSILPALDLLPALFQNPQRYKDLLGNRRGNTEMFLKQRWVEQNLQIGRFERNMYLCARDGDTTRWKKPKGLVSNTGVFVKYYDEYNMSLQTCGLDHIGL